MHFSSEQLPKSGKKSGFTLAEVIVATTLLGFAMSAIIGSLNFSYESLYKMGHMTEANENSRQVIQQLGQDLRSTVKVVEASPAKLQVVTEQPDGSKATVTYEYVSAAGVLKRTVGAKSEFLMMTLNDFSFLFFNSQDLQTARAIDIKKISIQMKQQVGMLKNGHDMDFRSARFLMRNRLAS